MTESITGVKPSGNAQSSVIRDLLDRGIIPTSVPTPSEQTTDQWVDAYRRAEFVENGLSDLSDLDIEFTKAAKLRRDFWVKHNTQIEEYQATDPGYLLKRLYIQDVNQRRLDLIKARKRVYQVVRVLGVFDGQSGQWCVLPKLPRVTGGFKKYEFGVEANHSENRKPCFRDFVSKRRAYLKKKQAYTFDENGQRVLHDNHRMFDQFVDWSDMRLVSEITVGVQDVFVTNTLRGGRPQQGGGLRGAITEFSEKSRARCEKHIRNLPTGSIKYFLTLTYPAGWSNDGVRIKRDLATMVKRLKRMGFGGLVWVLEFQSRGAPHFHLWLDRGFGGDIDEGIKLCANAWYEVVGSGNPNHLKVHMGLAGGGNKPCLEVVRNEHAPSYYAVKYCTKAEQKTVPEAYYNVGRFWGYCGDLKPAYQTFFARGEAACRAAVEMIKNWRMAKWGGVVTGEPVMYSATFRGCTPEFLSELFDHSGWCPD